MGVGATKRLTAVRWGVSASIIWAWVLTIPITAAISAGLFLAARMIFAVDSQ
jgi:PiT family inorganic phosphate transporter